MISKIILIKSIDAIIGRIFVRLLPPPPDPPVTQTISRILVIRPGGIGDAVLLLPAIAAIKKLLPASEIHILAERRNCTVFELSPHVSSVSCYDNPSELFRAVRSGYDAVIDTEQWHRLSAVIARLTGAPLLAGFGTNERKRQFNISVTYSHDDYETTSFRNLVRAVLPALPDVAPQDSISLPERANQKVKSLLMPLSEVHTYVALFPGASIPEKTWPVQSWHNLAERLSAYGLGIVIVGGGDVKHMVDPIMRGLSGISAVGQLTLAETAALLQRTQLLISGDSGVLHLATLVGTPTVSLFGPSNSAKWAPSGETHLVVGRQIPCSPCSEFGTTPPCPINARCMRDISVDEVVNAVTMLLTSVGAMPSHCCKRDWIETS